MNHWIYLGKSLKFYKVVLKESFVLNAAVQISEDKLKSLVGVFG